MNTIDLEESPELIHTHPGFEWRGHQLPAALGTGHELLMAQIASREDIYHIRAFHCLYILTHDRKEIQKESRDADALRVKILDWIDTLQLNHDELKEVGDLFEKLLVNTQAGTARVVRTGSETGKA